MSGLTEKQELKIELFNQGVIVSDQAREAIAGVEGKPLSTGDYASTNGLALNLGEGIFVNAPFQDLSPNFVREGTTPHHLDFEGGQFFVRSDDKEFKARYIPVAGYYMDRHPGGENYRDIVVTHTDRARISPVEGCSIKCNFCNLPFDYKYRIKDEQDLVDSVRVAVDDPVVPAQHVLISGGTPGRKHFEYENRVYKRVAEEFPGLDVDIMMAPVPGLLDPKTLKGFGINELSINMELWNIEIAEQKARGKWRIGRDNYLKFIAEAVEVFGPGKIRSLLMVGLEPEEDTLRGVQALAERGCDPVLSPFRPDRSTPLALELPPSVALQKEVYQRGRDIVEKYPGVKLGPRCMPCMHNTLTFPDDSGAFYYHRYDKTAGVSTYEPDSPDPRFAYNI